MLAVQLEGSLDIFPLRELIEMVTYSSVTGVLEVYADEHIGRLFFSDGRPYHAVADDLTGVDAVGRMFEQQHAPFRFVADQVDSQATLWIDPWDLIDRGEDLAAKWIYIHQHVPTVDHIPHLVGTLTQSPVHINDTIWPVLAAVDGQRSAREAAEHLNLVLLDTCLALATLSEQGLVTIQPPRAVPVHPSGPPALFAPPSAAAAAAPVDTAEPAAAGFLERLLAEAQGKAQQRPELTDDVAQERKQVYRYVDDRR